MMETLMDFHVLDRLTAVAVLSLVALSIITDKLVWHTRLKKAEDRAERYEAAFYEALTIGANAGVRAAEVAVGVVSSLPDPANKQERGV